MKKLGFLIMLVICMMIASCQKEVFFDKIVSINDEATVHLVSMGESYDVKLDYFELDGAYFTYRDTITVDDRVVTSSTGFSPPKYVETVSSKDYGNYTLRRNKYRTCFYVYIASDWHETYEHALPFAFFAEEICLDNDTAVKQPFVFYKGTTEEKLELADETEGVYKHYLLNFPIIVYNKYTKKEVYRFTYLYHCIVLNDSVWF